MDNNEFGQALIAETNRRILDESIPRIRRCMDLLSDQELWHRPGGAVVSAGNYILHLCGNARQWIGTGLGGHANSRDRDAEFAEQGPVDRADLVALLDETAAMIQAVLSELDPATLLVKRPVQIFEESGLSILVHVIEHFSYHTGQITYHTKLVKNVDTGYYAGLDLTGDGTVAE